MGRLQGKLPVSAMAASIWFVAFAAGAKDLVEYRLSDFIAGATGRQTGPLSLEITVTVRNPASEPVCFYPGLVGAADIVPVGRPGYILWSAIDDPDANPEEHQLVGGWLNYSPADHQFSAQIAEYDPGLSLQPGDRYEIKEHLSIDQYAMIYGSHDGEARLETIPAPAGMYQVGFRGLQVFRCNRLTASMRKKVQEERFGYHSAFKHKISKDFPDGDFWQFQDQSSPGQPFKLHLPAAPAGYEYVVYDFFPVPSAN